MSSAVAINDERETQRKASKNIISIGAEYNEGHLEAEAEAEMTRQFRWIKQNLGLGAILGAVATFLSALAVIVLIASPAVKQGEINGATLKAIDTLVVAQKENKEEQAKALSDAVTRIETLVNRSVDLAQANREDMRSMRESLERRLGLVEQKTDSNWNWMTDLKTRVGQVEIELKKREK